MNDALRYLVVTGFKGSVKHKLRRLKQPKYLLAMLAVIAYFGLIFGPQFFLSGNEAMKTPILHTQLGALAMVVLQLALPWLTAGHKGGLGLTPAEHDVLMAAPLSNRAVVAYRLMKYTPQLIFTTLILAVIFTARHGLLSLAISLIGVFFLMYLGAAMAVAVTQLVSRLDKARAWLLRIAFFLLLFAPLLAPVPLFMQGYGFVEVLDAVFAGEGTTIVLYPYVLMAQAAVPETFRQALPGFGLLVFTAGMLSEIAMRIRAGSANPQAGTTSSNYDKMVAARRGRAMTRDKDVKKPLFALKPFGRAWRALAWKSMVSTTRGIPLAAIIMVINLVIMGGVIASTMADEGVAMALALLAVILTAMITLMASAVFREDLRGDIEHLDMLKALPLNGRNIIRGEVYGPAVIVGVMASLCWLFGMGVAIGSPPDGVPRIDIAIIGGVVLLHLIPLQVLLYACDNLLAAQMPAWMMIPKGEGNAQVNGMENMGQNLILMLIKLFAVLLASVIPGGILAGAIWAAIEMKQLWPLIPAGIVSAGLFLVAAELVITLAGSTFERIDSAIELSG